MIYDNLFSINTQIQLSVITIFSINTHSNTKSGLSKYLEVLNLNPPVIEVNNINAT